MEKYEKAVHKREKVDRDFVQSFMCDNPLYDPSNETDASIPCQPEKVGVDSHREFKDEGLYSGLGGYHMYHRIDGKLVAVGIIDICTTVLNSAYFIYDPDYRHYNLGVVGAVIEIEYMRMVKERFND